jgi:hypothetical protein
MQAYLEQARAVLVAGYDQINGPQGLLIALAATIFLRSWKQWIPAAMIATIVHVGIGHFTPMVRGEKALELPDFMNGDFWGGVGVALVGYLIVIAIMFFAKRILMTALASSGAGKRQH